MTFSDSDTQSAALSAFYYLSTKYTLGLMYE